MTDIQTLCNTLGINESTLKNLEPNGYIVSYKKYTSDGMLGGWGKTQTKTIVHLAQIVNFQRFDIRIFSVQPIFQFQVNIGESLTDNEIEELSSSYTGVIL